MYRSVGLDLLCGRCGRAHRAEVQFKTEDDQCETYAVGDLVEDLPVGEEWEGIADRFCPSCRDAHRAERERAAATVAAAMMRPGQLALKLAEAEAPLTADEILARGKEQAEVVQRSPVLHSLPLVLTDLSFLDHAWLPTTSSRTSW